MKSHVSWMAAAVLGTLLTGCIDDQTTLKLNKDGSGTLIQEVYFSPQIAAMTDGMTAGMGAAMNAGGEKPATPAAPADPLVTNAAEIDKRVAAMGPGAKLEKKEAKTNAKGWKGFALTYSFADVTKLQLNPGSNSDGGEGDDGDKAPPMKIEFRKAPKPTIGFWEAPKPKKPDAAAAAAPADASNPMGDAMGAAMMGPMLQGMRIAFKVEVDGKITRTNSANKQGDHTVSLLDVPMDKLMTNPQAAKLMGGNAQDPDMLKKLRALNVPGLMIDDLEKGIAIEFE